MVFRHYKMNSAGICNKLSAVERELYQKISLRQEISLKICCGI